MPPTPAEQRLIDRTQQIADSYARSSDLRLRILFSVDGMEESDGLWYPHETIPAADLVEQARGNTDPLALDLLFRRCAMTRDAQSGCDRLAIARRWTEADTQNQLAWLALAEVLQQRGRHDEARGVFERGAQASLWHDHYVDAARLVVRALPPNLTAAERESVGGFVLSKAGLTIPLSTLFTLGQFCKDAALRAACQRYVVVMVRDSQLLVSLNLAAPYAARARMPRETITGYQEKMDAMRWVISRGARPADAGTNVDEQHAGEQRLERMLAIGEVPALEAELAAAHLTEAEAARRYVAGLTAAQREQHAQWVQLPSP